VNDAFQNINLFHESSRADEDAVDSKVGELDLFLTMA